MCSLSARQVKELEEAVALRERKWDSLAEDANGPTLILLILLQLFNPLYASRVRLGRTRRPGSESLIVLEELDGQKGGRLRAQRQG